MKKIRDGEFMRFWVDPVLAELGAQSGLDVGRARQLLAADVQALKLVEQAAAREWRQSLQKFQYPIDLRHWGRSFR